MASVAGVTEGGVRDEIEKKHVSDSWLPVATTREEGVVDLALVQGSGRMRVLVGGGLARDACAGAHERAPCPLTTTEGVWRAPGP